MFDPSIFFPSISVFSMYQYYIQIRFVLFCNTVSKNSTPCRWCRLRRENWRSFHLGVDTSVPVWAFFSLIGSTPVSIGVKKFCTYSRGGVRFGVVSCQVISACDWLALGQLLIVFLEQYQIRSFAFFSINTFSWHCGTPRVPHTTFGGNTV